jgi:UDP-arabinose 4-epimerase
MVEQILRDYANAYGFRFAALRYFNACGADPDGEIGEEHDPETHLIPRALMTAAGLLPHLDVYGNDYDTADGTCIRDYIHVLDLARGHLAALDVLRDGAQSLSVNLASGRGFSIREIIDAAVRTTDCRIPVEIKSRRPGDPPVLIACPERARTLLGFTTQYSDLDTIIRTAWRFQKSRVRHPV